MSYYRNVKEVRLPDDDIDSTDVKTSCKITGYHDYEETDISDWVIQEAMIDRIQDSGA